MNKPIHEQIEELAEAIEAGQKEHKIKQIQFDYLNGVSQEACTLGCAYAHVNPELTWEEKRRYVTDELHKSFPVLAFTFWNNKDQQFLLQHEIVSMNDNDNMYIHEIVEWLRNFAKDVEKGNWGGDWQYE